MRTLERNKQKIFYSNNTGSTYDGDGNYVVIDGVRVPVEIGSVTEEYSIPVEKAVNISLSGETTVQPYGINAGGYDAIIVANKGELPIKESSLIWYKCEPTYLDPETKKKVDPASANYTVRAIDDSLNVFRAFLQRSVKQNDT